MEGELVEVCGVEGELVELECSLKTPVVGWAGRKEDVLFVLQQNHE